jgi:hypothetical protein
MITTCKKCGSVLLLPVGLPVATLRSLACKCGHNQLVVGMPTVTHPMLVHTGRRVFSWLPEFPPRL